MLPTAEEVSSKYDLTGKVALVTGATSGLGRETARVLALRNCKVLLGARTLEKGTEAKNQILLNIGGDKADLIEPVALDLSSLSGVRHFITAFKTRQDQRLDILINNAGALFAKRELTSDGLEQNFGVNHLAPFLLTLSLIPYLKQTALKTGEPARIVNVSSVAHAFVQKVDFTDYNSESLEYDAMGIYSISKLANLYTSRELNQRLMEAFGRDNLIISNAIHPGTIWTPGLNSGVVPIDVIKSFPVTFVSIPEGAATQVFVAIDRSIKVGGLYYDQCEPVTPSVLGQDEQEQKKLWALSEQLAGLRFNDAIKLTV